MNKNSMQKINLSFSYNDSVARIILNDGKGNIIDTIMMSELQSVLDSFRTRTDLKLIILEGAGKHFSFGASVEEHKKEFAGNMLHSFHNLFYTISDLSIPLLAKVSGQCLGGAMELALICNFIFADKSAVLGQPEIQLGVFPPPASILLPLKIGYAKAEELLITGKRICAAEAMSMGIVNQVYEDRAKLDEAVEIWVQKNILPLSASSLRYAVRASRSFLNHILSKFLPQLEQYYVGDLMETPDANEGINSFLEKRKPIWQND